jgi:chromosomal replication initiation ATPase DnaA
MIHIVPSVPKDPAASAAPAISDPERIFRCVTSCVASDFELDEKVLAETTRGAPRVAFARQVAMYLAHVGFALSFAAVGRMFGRDRTTVSHACRVIEDGRDDAWLDRRLAVLERACRRGSGWQGAEMPRAAGGRER